MIYRYGVQTPFIKVKIFNGCTGKDRLRTDFVFVLRLRNTLPLIQAVGHFHNSVKRNKPENQLI